jgi:hypothetical protein
MPAEKKPATVPVGSLKLDSEVYRAVTQLAYFQQMPVEQMINQMLRRQVVSQELFRHGYTITHRETIKPLTNMLSDNDIVEAAKSMSPLSMKCSCRAPEAPTPASSSPFRR